MPYTFHKRVIAALDLFTWCSGAAAVLLGVMVLLGWAVGSPALVTVLPGLTAMSPLTATGFVLSGLSLLLAKRRSPRVAPASAAFFLLAICGAVLVSYMVTGRDVLDPWIEAWLGILRDGQPGLMAPATLASFTLLGCALLLLPHRGGKGGRLLAAFTVPGILLSGAALLGYAYDVDGLYTSYVYRTMALHTAAGLLLLFLACLAYEPKAGWAAIFASGLPSGSATRVQLLLATVLPFLTGLVLVRAEQAGRIAPSLGLAVLVTVTMVPLVFRIFRDGAMLDDLEMKRMAAASTIQALNEALDEKVRDRTTNLERSEARFRTYFDNAPEGLVLFRAAGDDAFVVEGANGAFRIIHDLQDRDIVGLEPRAWLDVEHALELVAHLTRCLATEEACHFETKLSVGAAAKLLDVILATVPSRAPGDARFIMGSIRDVSEAVLREEQLRQAQKMEAVGQLTGGLAHDFNNLLTGISGSLELLNTRMAQGRIQDAPKYIAAAHGAAARAAKLTHRLLAFSRRQTLEPQAVDVNRLVNGMEDFIRRTVGPAVNVEIVGAAGLWAALVDPSQRENALLNLCINARDAMPSGGRLTIETANKWLDARAGKERDLPPGQYLSLCVTDAGVGMTPDVVSRAFEPFFTTKPLGEGTGLGLSMIYGFVRQSGGQVRIYSEPGQGTTICLYLPRHHLEPEITQAEANPADVPRAREGETVLIVDDEPTVRMLVTDVLGEHGYIALEAADGPAGLRILESSARVDLLITDVGLPGLNGRQMADAARRGRPDLKVLFITGFAENAVLGDGRLDRGMHILTKPFEIHAFCTLIKELIEHD